MWGNCDILSSVIDVMGGLLVAHKVYNYYVGYFVNYRVHSIVDLIMDYAV